jgi:hypothetical protein
MAITIVETQITWDTGSTSKNVTSATEVVSDAFTLDATCIKADITVYADNAGTPASGDTAVFRVRGSAGDILGDTGDDFDTAEHARHLATLDTYASNTPGEDPAQRTIVDALAPQKFKLACICANAATRNMTIRARVVEQRSA